MDRWSTISDIADIVDQILLTRVSGQVVTENRIPVCWHNTGTRAHLIVLYFEHLCWHQTTGTRAVKPDQEGDIINVIFIIVVLVNVIVCDVINETMMSGEVLEAGNNSIW